MGPGEPFEFELTPVVEGELAAGGDQFPQQGRHEHLAPDRLRRNAGGEDDVGPEEVVAGADRLPGVEADAEAQC